ncbi:MAG: hypothetical protein HY706_10125 [Candidatus Hydrogenedentes bacterium]|nr:hypothetical protein [Candidatus Hydrogenedentota bacterium]
MDYRGAILCWTSLITVVMAEACADQPPKMLAYSAFPTPYFNDDADGVAHLYDGFFFVIGTWDEGVPNLLGLPGEPARDSRWKEQVRENLRHLRAVGVTENLLGISFSESAPWPSPQTLLEPAYTEKMARHFTALGQAAKDLGFRGVSIDIEYPYPRYELDHEIYTYEGYTAEDLLAAAAKQGRTVISAVLDAFPEAVVFVLPGELANRPLSRAFQLAMVETMAERDAPGGYHLGYERAYGLLDPVTQVAIPRVGDCDAERWLSAAALEYWKRRCTVAPGVWPLHMVETSGKDYPKRAWSEEMAELRQQMGILRAVAKRYIWSFSGQPVWFLPTAETVEHYALPKPNFEDAEEAVAGWHRILTEPSTRLDPRLERLIGVVADFDRGSMSAREFCNRLGTPGTWLLLGPLGNPFINPPYAATAAALRPVRMDEPIHGRDGAVQWRLFPDNEPTGSVRLMAAHDWRDTDKASAHLVTMIQAKKETDALLRMNWDDGVVVWINDQLVFDHRTYPPRGHGLLYRDRYLFEDHVPVHIPRGESRLTVTSINSHGHWGFCLRITDPDGYPLEGIRFRVPSGNGFDWK